MVSCSDGEKCQAIMRDRMLLVQKFDDYLRESSSVINAQYTERLKHSSVIYGLTLSAEENQLNQQCYNEIMQIYHGINRKEIWAMKSEFRDFKWVVDKEKKLTQKKPFEFEWISSFMINRIFRGRRADSSIQKKWFRCLTPNVYNLRINLMHPHSMLDKTMPLAEA